jgi:hypothetical protein
MDGTDDVSGARLSYALRPRGHGRDPADVPHARPTTPRAPSRLLCPSPENREDHP